MSTSHNIEPQTAESAYVPAIQSPAQLQLQTPFWIRTLAHYFAGTPVSETVATCLHFEASPQAVWNALCFYEDVIGKPSWILRSFIPPPVRAEGHKSRPGVTIRCVYIGGELLQRITAVEPLHHMSFQVLQQSLGIEDIALAQSGSYDLSSTLSGTHLLLTTNYLAKLHPRFLWRPFEKLVARQLHRHIFRGMKSSIT